MGLMPETTRLLKGADNQISAAILSILEPGKHIVSHCGAMRSVYRYHLGLQVDEANDAYIQVEDLTYHWKVRVVPQLNVPILSGSSVWRPSLGCEEARRFEEAF